MQNLQAAKFLFPSALLCIATAAATIAPTVAQENTEPLQQLTALAETTAPSSLDLELPGLDSPLPLKLKAPSVRMFPRVLASSGIAVAELWMWLEGVDLSRTRRFAVVNATRIA